MPRVEKDAEVTLVVLTYRSLRWLDWCISGTDESKNLTRYRWLVVANDATDEVIAGLSASDLDWIDHRNTDPGEFYINRVYRAWNRGVREAKTSAVIMLNSDMYGSDSWIDELVSSKCMTPFSVPTSLLVESGRIPSAMPEHVMDFGLSPDTFKAKAFRDHAAELRQLDSTETGRLYMPILVDRQEFFDIGGYPNGNPLGTTGDKDLIRRYNKAGFAHETVLGSVVYHAQEGEGRWP